MTPQSFITQTIHTAVAGILALGIAFASLWLIAEPKFNSQDLAMQENVSWK